MRRAALLEDPHRIGVRIRHQLLYLEELGDIVRQLRCPVAGIRNEGPAADCEHPDRERRDQAQTQNEPQPACDKLDVGRTMHGLTAIIDGALAVLQSGSLPTVLLPSPPADAKQRHLAHAQYCVVGVAVYLVRMAR